MPAPCLHAGTATLPTVNNPPPFNNPLNMRNTPQPGQPAWRVHKPH